MSVSKLLTIGFCLLLFCALAVPRSMADEWNKATKVTFSGPVEVPGRVLDAGTYWFTLMDNPSNRNIVQVWNSDRTQLITTILAIPDYRLQPKGETVMKFEERPSNNPEALQAWFYPGDNFGQEFVYPQARATELAKRIGQPVLSTAESRTTATAMKQAPVKAVNPSGQSIEMGEVVQSKPQPATRPAPLMAANTQLPKTASLLPLWGLLGLLFISAGFALRWVVRSME
jgi:hypothetical protein